MSDADHAHMLAFWGGRVEDAGAVARRTAATLQRLEFLCPPDGWRYPDGNVWAMWPSSPREQERWVESKIFRTEDGDPDPVNGHSFSLSQEVKGLYVNLRIEAGGSIRGGRLPVNRVSCVVRGPVPGGFTAAVVDSIVEAVVEVWEPVVATFRDHILVGMARPTSSWQVPVGYRVWAHDTVGSISQVTEGVLVSRLGVGTQLSAPDEWTVEQVVESMRETLSMNDIDEVPHGN